MCRSSLNLVSLDLGIPQSMYCTKVHKVYYEKILSLFTYEFQVKMVLGTPSVNLPIIGMYVILQSI